MTSCFLLTRAAYEKVGPMDERFPLYFNDVDWCLRAQNKGISIWYTPDAVAIHGYGGTTKKVRKAAIWESHRALLRLWSKHYRETTPRVLYVIMKALVTLGAWMRSGRWGKSLGKDGGETTPENLHRELERAG
jgi:GT2 family glycosyltransferase